MELPYNLMRLKEVEPPDVLPVDENQEYEIKWNGWRMAVIISLGKVTLLSRNGTDYTDRFQEVADDMRSAVSGHRAVIDGEIIREKAGRHDLKTLHQRGGRLMLCAFDLLELDGEPLVDEPWHVRRAELEGVSEPQPHAELPPYFDDQMDAIDYAIEHGDEGVVSKRRDSRYRQIGNAPNGDWRKMKFETYERKLRKYNQRKPK